MKDLGLLSKDSELSDPIVHLRPQAIPAHKDQQWHEASFTPLRSRSTRYQRDISAVVVQGDEEGNFDSGIRTLRLETLL